MNEETLQRQLCRIIWAYKIVGFSSKIFLRPWKGKLCRTQLSVGKRNLKENSMELVREHENGWAATKTKKKHSKKKQPSVNNRSQMKKLLSPTRRGGTIRIENDNCRHLAQQTVETWKEINRFHIRRQKKTKAQKRLPLLETRTIIS